MRFAVPTEALQPFFEFAYLCGTRKGQLARTGWSHGNGAVEQRLGHRQRAPDHHRCQYREPRQAGPARDGRFSGSPARRRASCAAVIRAHTTR